MGRILAVSDLHGNYELWEQVKAMLAPDDVLYVLGDCADRGKYGMEIILEVLADKRCIYIKGNHEDLFVRAVLHGDRMLHDYNGGKPTYKAWKYKYDHNMQIIHTLQNLPDEKVYINKRGQRVVMTHAGYTPHLCNFVWSEDKIWDRHHFNNMWDVDFVDTIMVHGHTPIPIIEDYLWDAPRESEVVPGVFWYCKDDKGVCHKVDIDCGAAFTGHTTVLDLDTWEEHKFFAKETVYKTGNNQLVP